MSCVVVDVVVAVVVSVCCGLFCVCLLLWFYVFALCCLVVAFAGACWLIVRVLFVVVFVFVLCGVYS